MQTGRQSDRQIKKEKERSKKKKNVKTQSLKKVNLKYFLILTKANITLICVTLKTHSYISFYHSFSPQYLSKWRHGIQHYDTQHIDTKHKGLIFDTKLK